MSDPGEDVIAPDDLDALGVHADALIERGSFFGEVIATQLEIHSLGDGGDLAKRTELATVSRKLLTRHHAEIFGDLAPHALSIVPKSPGEPTGQFAACTASWRLGAIDEVALAASSKIVLADVVPALARVKAARHVRSIVVGSSAPPSARWAPVAYDHFVVALAAHAHAFPRLRSLFLGDLGEGRVAAEVGALAPLYAGFPDLEVLRVRAHDVDLGSPSLAQLREIELIGNCASLAALRTIAKVRLPELVAVTAHQGRATHDLPSALDALSTLPRLERLALRGWYGSGMLASTVAFPRLAQLTELDLSHNDLSDELALLVEQADRFAHLEKLDLRFNGLTIHPDLFRELRRRLPRADLAGQSVEPRDDERYDEIRE